MTQQRATNQSMEESARDTSPPELGASGELSPNDHLKMLIEMLKPAGPELGRRWLAALLMVPPEERESVVQAVESQIVAEYGSREAPFGG